MTNIEEYYRKIAREEAEKVLGEQKQLGEFLTTTDAAKVLGVHRSWLDQARVNEREQAPPFYRFDRAIRYKRADLDAWIEASRREVTAS